MFLIAFRVFQCFFPSKVRITSKIAIAIDETSYAKMLLYLYAKDDIKERYPFSLNIAIITRQRLGVVSRSFTARGGGNFVPSPVNDLLKAYAG